MRSKLAVGMLAMATAVATISALPGTAQAAEPGPTLSFPTVRPVQEAPTLDVKTPAGARAALAAAKRVTQGNARAGDPEITLARRDLFLARPHLSGDAAAQADALMARPFGDSEDTFGRPGLGGKVKRICNARLCIVYTKTGPHAATKKWAKKSFRTMNKVWTKEVKRMGYRAPKRDGRRGGNGKLDVYLVDGHSQGYYGFCQPEYYARGKGNPASGYCALDNDMKNFPSTPVKALKATAAHEFFHAVQFAYDVEEDRWMMESSATWMEERAYDGVNDNRQYLAHSQLANPFTPLTAYDRARLEQYGNWIWWEYLGKRYGQGIVKKTWTQAQSKRVNSLKALKRVLKRKGGLNRVYADYTARLMVPKKGFPEGRSYRTYNAPTSVLGKGQTARTSGGLARYSSAPFTLKPGSRKGKLKVVVNGLPRKSRGLTVAITKRSGKVVFKRGKITRKGVKIAVPFGARKVRKVSLPLTNGGNKNGTISVKLRVK